MSSVFQNAFRVVLDVNICISIPTDNNFFDLQYISIKYFSERPALKYESTALPVLQINLPGTSTHAGFRPIKGVYSGRQWLFLWVFQSISHEPCRRIIFNFGRDGRLAGRSVNYY